MQLQCRRDGLHKESKPVNEFFNLATEAWWDGLRSFFSLLEVLVLVLKSNIIQTD